MVNANDDDVANGNDDVGAGNESDDDANLVNNVVLGAMIDMIDVANEHELEMTNDSCFSFTSIYTFN